MSEKKQEKKPEEKKPDGRQLKKGCSVTGIGKPYVGGTKTGFIPESVIKKYDLKDKIFV